MKTYIALLILALLSLSSCEKAPAFQIVSFFQNENEEVRLNETLVFRFSDEIDRTTVSRLTVSVVSSTGIEAKGKLMVIGPELSFVPNTPLHKDMSDVGLSPGEEYQVTIKGFPSYCAVLSTDGRHLDRRYRFSFKTKSKHSNPLDMFVDSNTESGPMLTDVQQVPIEKIDPFGVSVKPGELLLLKFSEPIFPGSLENSCATINMINSQELVDKELDKMRLFSRLIENVAKEGSLIGIQPDGGFKKGGSYKLFRASLDFYDFGGKSIEKTKFNFIRINCVDDS